MIQETSSPDNTEYNHHLSVLTVLTSIWHPSDIGASLAMTLNNHGVPDCRCSFLSLVPKAAEQSRPAANSEYKILSERSTHSYEQQ